MSKNTDRTKLARRYAREYGVKHTEALRMVDRTVEPDRADVEMLCVRGASQDERAAHVVQIAADRVADRLDETHIAFGFADWPAEVITTDSEDPRYFLDEKLLRGRTVNIYNVTDGRFFNHTRATAVAEAVVGLARMARSRQIKIRYVVPFDGSRKRTDVVFNWAQRITISPSHQTAWPTTEG